MLASIGSISCGHIATYTDPDLKVGKTGILYYPPKPYLLVANTGAKDNPTKVDVIYLPDLSQPRYAVMKSGYGASKLSLAFSNGVLTSAGQETDPKITEAITALAGVPGALAEARKTRAETEVLLRPESSDLPKVAKDLENVAADFEALASDQRSSNALLPGQRDILIRLPKALRDAAAILMRPDTKDVEPILKVLEALKKQADEIKPGSETVSDADRTFWAKAESAKSALGTIVGELKPKPETPPTLVLYEVLVGPHGTELREVPLSTVGR